MNPVYAAADRMIDAGGPHVSEAVIELIWRFAHEAALDESEVAEIVAAAQRAVNAAWADGGIGMFDLTTSAARPNEQENDR